MFFRWDGVDMRYFLGLTEISGMYSAYKKGFDEIGVKSDFFTFAESRFFKHKNDFFIADFITKCLKVSKNNSWLFRYFAKLIGGLFCIIFFIFAIIRYDVFIFSYTTSLFPNNRDLPFLKLFGKKIIWIFNGSDIRPPFMDGALIYSYNCSSVWLLVKDAEISKQRAQYIEKYSDLIIAQPCHCMFLSKPFVNSVYIGVPVIEKYVKHNKNLIRDESVLRVFHAPSSPYSKGTFKIREYIKEINKELEPLGKKIEYIEKSDVSHDEVISEMANADIVFDQLYSDIMIPVVTAEAMMLGKPSIVGGYVKMYRDIYQKITPIEYCDFSPIVYVLPEKDEIKQAICKFFDSNYRKKCCENARKVYDKWCNPIVAATILNRIIEDVFLKQDKNIKSYYSNIICDPNKILYYHGCGIDETKLKEILRRVCEIRPNFVFDETRTPLVEEINKWIHEC